MNTKKRLNCYLFSNLIISFLSLHFLMNDTSSTLVLANNQKNNDFLHQVYQKEVLIVSSPIFESSIKIQEEPPVVNKTTTQSNSTIPYVKPSYNSVTGANLVSYAKRYLGLSYVSGGNSLVTGTDCSGFTKLIFKEFGIELGRTVSSQLYNGTYISKADLKPGDLVFYGYSNYATHVGIYMGNGLVIHESNPRDGVKINSVNMMVYITARRLITANIVVKKEIEEEKKESQETDSSKEEVPVTNPKEEVDIPPVLEKEETEISSEIENQDENINLNEDNQNTPEKDNQDIISNNQEVDSIDSTNEKEVSDTPLK